MFKFKGISSTEMKVIPKEENFIARASQRYEVITIEGKDGEIFIPAGYKALEKDLELQILDVEKVDQILKWLNGEGLLEFNGKVANARFFAGFDVDRFVTLKKTQISYIRDPFWYKADDGYTTTTSTVVNEGNIYAKPLVKLAGTGTVDLSINGTRFQYTFTDPYVEIDCENMTEKYEGLLRSRNMEMGLDYPRLEPGENEVILHSGTCTIQMMRKDRWL